MKKFVRPESSIVHLACIAVLGGLLYINSLQVPFYLDDYREIVYSPLLKNFSHLKSYLTDGGVSALLSRSFGYMTFALNYKFGGLDVIGYHLVNAVIHIATALSVYWFVSLTLMTPPFSGSHGAWKTGNRAGFIAFLAALLFVAHPLQTSAVTYIVQRFASLAALLYLLSLIFYVKARLIMKGPVKRPLAAAAYFTAALSAGALAIMTKQNAFTLPLAVMLYEMIFFPDDLKGKARTIGMLFAASAVGAAVMIALSGKPASVILAAIDRATTVEPHLSRLDYLATQLRVLVTYLRLLVVPVNQQLDYNYKIYSGFRNLDVLLSAALLGALFLFAVYCLAVSRRQSARFAESTPLVRLIAFGIFWFFVTMLIESSIIPITDVIFEHRMYLPSVGLFMALASAVSLANHAAGPVPGWPRSRVLAVSLGVVLALGGMTIARNRLWSDEVSFWADNAAKSPLNGRVFNHLAMARMKRGDLAGAEQAYLKAIDLRVHQASTFVNLSQIYIGRGELDRALELLHSALSINAGMAEAHVNIGIIYSLQNKTDDAIREFLLAVKLKPALANAYNNLALMYGRQKKYAEALEYFTEAIRRNPDYANAYVNRGQLMMTLNRREDAVADYRRALQLEPANAAASAELRRMGSGTGRQK